MFSATKTNPLFEALCVEASDISPKLSEDNEKNVEVYEVIRKHWQKIRMAAVAENLFPAESKGDEAVALKRKLLETIEKDFAGHTFRISEQTASLEKFKAYIESFEDSPHQDGGNDFNTLELFLVFDHYAKIQQYRSLTYYAMKTRIENPQDSVVSLFSALTERAKEIRETPIISYPETNKLDTDELFSPLMNKLLAEKERGYLKTLFFSGDKFGRAHIKQNNHVFLSRVKKCLDDNQAPLQKALAAGSNKEDRAILALVKDRIKEILSEHPLAGTGYHTKPSRTMKLLEKVMSSYGLIEDAEAFKAFVAEARNTRQDPSVKRRF